MKDFRTYAWGGRPVLAVSKTPRRLRRAAIRQYQAHTWRRKAFKFLLQFSLLFAVDGRFGKDTPMPRLLDVDLHDCMDRMACMLGKDRVDAAFTFPTQRGRGRLYVMLYGEDCRPIGFAKIVAGSGETMSVLEAEMNALKEIAALPDRAYHVPKVIALEAVGPCRLLLFQPLPASARPYPCSNHAAPDFLVSTARRRVEPDALDHLSWWPGLQAELSDDYAAFGSALEHYRKYGLQVGRAHGDLTPANIVTAGGVPWIYDWEHSQPDAPHSTDAIGFFLGCRSREAVAAPRQVMDDLHERFFDGRSEVEQADVAFSLACRLAHGCDDVRGILKHWNN